MEIRDIAKKKVPKIVDGQSAEDRKEAVLAYVHKSPEEIEAMSKQYAENVSGIGGTIAKVGGPVGRQIGNVASHIDSGSLRSLLRQAKNPELIKKAEEFIAKEMPLKEKSAGISRMVELLRSKLK